MANKEQLLIEFSKTGLARRCKNVSDLEQRFSRWMHQNDIYLRNYDQNDFYGSANFTVNILRKNKNLLYSFGLNESHLVRQRPEYRDNTKEPYSLLGQFKHYGNQVHNRGQDGNYRKHGAKGLLSAGTGKVILAVVIIAVLYSLLGDTVWNFITSGAIFKLICFAIGSLASIGILRSKNMGWPLPIKLVVIIVIWVVLVNYDF